MDDIFYLSSKKVDIKDINEIAKEINVKNTFIPKSSDVLEIEYCDGIVASWFTMNKNDFKESEEEKFLVENKIQSIFCISYHPSNLYMMLPHIRRLLKEYGGWIGNDSEGFQPYFNLQNIDLFN